MEKKSVYVLFIFLLIISLLCSIIPIYAFGVSAPYWEGNPLKMNEGESKEVLLNLQNMNSETDSYVTANIINGSNIANLNQRDYQIKANTSDTYLKIIVNLPKDFNKEKEKISIEFKQSSANSSGGVMMSSGYITSFDVINLSYKSKISLKWIIFSIIIIILIIILIIFILRKNRGKKNKKF